MNKATALYLRLSVDDDNSDESNSIQAQRDMLYNHAKTDPLLTNTEIIEVVDDGWSGTSFERPGVQSLLERTRRGEIACILVKDSSRWGRNYIEVNEYLEQIFPFLGIRFISINDGYDSNNHIGSTAPIDMAFGTIMHDIYCKELSVKVKQSYVRKAEKGEFQCGFAPFGFEKSTEVKNKLIIDEEAAAVVRRIFALAIDGNTTTQIAKLLNSESVDTPLIYRRRKGRQQRGGYSAVSEIGSWSDNIVRKILRDERYIGTQVSGKTRKPKPGSKKAILLPESEWIKVPGTHDPIVSEDVFRKAKDGIRPFNRTGKSNGRALFAGKVRCGVCGHALQYAARKDPCYYCESDRLGRNSDCFTGRILVSDICELVLAAIKVEAGKALDKRQKRRKSAQHDLSDAEAARMEIDRLTAQIARLERRSISLYEEYADGSIDRDAYLSAKTKDQAEIANMESRLSELRERVSVNAITDSGASDEPLLKRILTADEITAEVLALIHCITVYDEEHIEISFTFGDTNE